MRLIPEININSQTMLTQNPYFYQYGTNSAVIDAELARQRLDSLNKRNGPRVGDFVWFPNEHRPRRFTYDWSDGSIQTTTKKSNDSSFQITRDGHCHFSGSLDSAIWLDQCHDTGQKLLGRVWFFSRDLSGAYRDVTVSLPFRVYEYWPIKLICPNCHHEDCEAVRFCDDCNMRVCQSCFDEHVFDFPSHICNTHPEANDQSDLTEKGYKCTTRHPQ
jgi:hypothetical protein